MSLHSKSGGAICVNVMAWVSRASELCAVYTFIVLLRAVCCVINIIVVNGLVGVCVGVRVFACARACVCMCVCVCVSQQGMSC